MNGILRCARYAFGPNRLHYCGPDANAELKTHINERINNPGLEHLLEKFKTMYPYLRQIALSNKIKDPFDDKVVEAYWIGNSLLDKIGKRALYDHLVYDHMLRRKLNVKVFSKLSDKVGKGALAHHSFHVFNIWKRTGHIDEEHTLQSMDLCRISSGVVKSVSGPNIVVVTEPLIFTNGKLSLGNPIEKKIIRRLESETDIEELKKGDIVTIHWDVPCEVITRREAERLKYYTLKAVELANS
jgi:hypothetical protein